MNQLTAGELFQERCEDFLERISTDRQIDLVLTSPPYNLGKDYESRISLDEYVKWQTSIIEAVSCRVKVTGSICWQVGNYTAKGSSSIIPIDILLDPVFRDLGFTLRNRIVWHYGHGYHFTRRFSGRYEVIMWYTKGSDYTFNLDPVRVPAKFPNKRHYKGPKKGELSGNPMGKNPSDVWEFSSIKHNHPEKTTHPCQFPVALAERLILSLTNEGDLVFDPFAGVASSGVAAIRHGRRYWGCEIDASYIEIGKQRIKDELNREMLGE